MFKSTYDILHAAGKYGLCDKLSSQETASLVLAYNRDHSDRIDYKKIDASGSRTIMRKLLCQAVSDGSIPRSHPLFHRKPDGKSVLNRAQQDPAKTPPQFLVGFVEGSEHTLPSTSKAAAPAASGARFNANPKPPSPEAVTPTAVNNLPLLSGSSTVTNPIMHSSPAVTKDAINIIQSSTKISPIRKAPEPPTGPPAQIVTIESIKCLLDQQTLTLNNNFNARVNQMNQVVEDQKTTMTEFIKTTTDKLSQLASLDDLGTLKESMNSLEAKFNNHKDEIINHLTDSEEGKKAIENLVNNSDLVSDKNKHGSTRNQRTCEQKIG